MLLAGVVWKLSPMHALQQWATRLLESAARPFSQPAWPRAGSTLDSRSSLLLSIFLSFPFSFILYPLFLSLSPLFLFFLFLFLSLPLSVFLKWLHSWMRFSFSHFHAAEMHYINSEAQCWLTIWLFVCLSGNILHHLCVKWHTQRKFVCFFFLPKWFKFRRASN